jgi:hypothetical protein
MTERYGFLLFTISETEHSRLELDVEIPFTKIFSLLLRVSFLYG